MISMIILDGYGDGEVAGDVDDIQLLLPCRLLSLSMMMVMMIMIIIVMKMMMMMLVVMVMMIMVMIMMMRATSNFYFLAGSSASV